MGIFGPLGGNSSFTGAMDSLHKGPVMWTSDVSSMLAASFEGRGISEEMLLVKELVQKTNMNDNIKAFTSDRGTPHTQGQ